MSFSHFPQYEHELFWRYYDRLHAFLAHCDFYLEKWKILNTVYKGVNCEARTLLEYWDFCAKNVDEAWDFLDWLARDTHEYEISCTNSCIPPPASLIMLLLCAKFAIVLIMPVILVPIIFLMRALLYLAI